MTFYDAGETVKKRIVDEETRCFVKILYSGANGVTEFPYEDILSFELTSYKAAEGGTVTRAKMELDDADGSYTDGTRLLNAALRWKCGSATELTARRTSGVAFFT